jgi:hypothetical protein
MLFRFELLIRATARGISFLDALIQDVEQSDIKGKLAVWRDTYDSLVIGQMGRDGQTALAINSHADYAKVPTLKDVIGSSNKTRPAEYHTIRDFFFPDCY